MCIADIPVTAITHISQRWTIVILITFLPLFGSVETTHMQSESSLCITRDLAREPQLVLPSNARLILQIPDQDQLQLFNPVLGTTTLLPETQNASVLRLTHHTRRFLIVRDLPTHRVWQTMEIDGSEVSVILEMPPDTVIQEIAVLSNDLAVKYIELYHGGYVLDLENGSVYDVPSLELPGVDPQWISFDHQLERIAYWVSYPYDPQLRLLDLTSGRIVEIEGPRGGVQWTPRDTLIELWHYDPMLAGDVLSVYDATQGTLEQHITRPPGFSYKYIESSIWSADERYLAVYYSDGADDPGRIHVFDFQESSWLDNCFQLESSDLGVYSLRPDAFFWTWEGRFLWWLEMVPQSEKKRAYDLVVADIETGAFEVVAHEVGLLSIIGTVDE